MEAIGASVEEIHPEAERILWDVMEEYVDEAEFAAEARESALDDPEYNLEELAGGPEGKLLACVDGLVVGGPLVVERLLVPEIDRADSEDPARTIAVVLALLASERRDLVAPYFSHDSEAVRGAASRGCALSSATKVDPWLMDQLAAAGMSAERSAVLDAIAARGLQVDSLVASLNSEDTAEVRAAARAARRADRTAHLGAVQWHLLQAESEVRDVALITALGYGSAEAWNLCERLALDPAEPNPVAMELYAALGGPPQHDRLVEALALDSHRAPALRALGFSGNLGVVDRLLPYLQEGADELEAKLSAEAIALITGLDLRDDAFIIEDEDEEEEAEEEALLPALDEDVEDDLALKPEDALPTPNPEAIRQWWETEGPRLDESTRHLAGQPWSGAAVADYLGRGPLRDRHMVALSLSIQTGGAAYVDTRALVDRQRAQISGVASLSTGSFVRKFSQW
jgi:uncharacterized protein (TIGR02270 family)